MRRGRVEGWNLETIGLMVLRVFNILSRVI